VRLRIVVVSAAAAAVLGYLGTAPGLQSSGTLLMFALFATDPSTMPKGTLAKALYGAFIGAGVVVFSRLLFVTGAGEELSKVFPVPIANLLVPAFEDAADRIERVAPKVRWLGYNVVHVALWLALVLPGLGDEKRRRFEAALHWTYGTPLVTMAGPAATPRCEENGLFCESFTFPREITGWAARLREQGR
jgi:hypothetical protein